MTHSSYQTEIKTLYYSKILILNFSPMPMERHPCEIPENSKI
jgi:hypothetical protein